MIMSFYFFGHAAQISVFIFLVTQLRSQFLFFWSRGSDLSFYFFSHTAQISVFIVLVMQLT